MFSNTRNFLKGYVEIEVSGFSAERFINLAVHKGIVIWDVVRDGAKLRMKVSVKSFRLLKPCARKSGCKIRIWRKNGIPFIMFKYRKRKLLVLGVFFFIAVIYAMSSFIWLVEIEGAKRTDTRNIITFLEQNGLSPGSFKPKVKERELEAALLQNFPGISWTDIDIKGTKAIVRITEAIPKKEIIDRTTPCNIVAACDGIIVSMATGAGTPLVRPGDVVEEGDLLVSSEITIGTPETEPIKKYVHAQSEVMAKRYYEFSIELPYVYYLKNYTGNIITNYSIIISGTQIPFLEYGIPFVSFDLTKSENRLGFGQSYPLPFIVVKEEYEEFEYERTERTQKEAEEIALRLLSQRIARELDIEAEIIDTSTEISDLGNRLRLDAVLTSIEQIGAKAELADSGAEIESNGVD